MIDSKIYNNDNSEMNWNTLRPSPSCSVNGGIVHKIGEKVT